MTLLRVLAGIESGKTVEQATRQFGIRRQYFYFWMRYPVTADYTMKGLKEKSRRPHRSPNATPEDVTRQAEEIRRIEGSGGHIYPRTRRLRAMERLMACYGIPELVQTDHGVEFTSRYASRRRASCSASPAVA
jgi:transposase-like protein